jgi:hypothetical protein
MNCALKGELTPVRIRARVFELEQEPGIGDGGAGGALILLDPGPVRAVPELGVARVGQVVDLRGQVVGIPVDLAAAAGDHAAVGVVLRFLTEMP